MAFPIIERDLSNGTSMLEKVEMPSLLDAEVSEAEKKLDKFSSIPEKDKEVAESILREAERIGIDNDTLKAEAIRQLGEADPKVTGRILVELKACEDEMDQLCRQVEEQVKLPRHIASLDRTDDVMHNYLRSVSKGDTLSPRELLNRALIRNKKQNIIDTARHICSLARNPNVVWHYLVQEGVVSQEYLDNIDLLRDYAEMSRKWHLVRDAKDQLSPEGYKAILSGILKPYLRKGVSSELILEAVEGRYELDEEFVNGSLEMFAQIQDDLVLKKDLHLRQRVAMVAVMGIMTATLSASNLQLPPLTDQQKRAEAFERYNEHRLREHNEAVAADKREYKEKSSSNPAAESNKKHKTENSNPEKLGMKGETAVWTLQGGDLDGYYKDSTADFFDDSVNDYGWFSGGGSADYLYKDGQPEPVKTQVSRSFDYVPNTIDLVTKYGQKVDPDHVKITLDGRRLSDADYWLYALNDGSYHIQLTPKPRGKLNLTYGVSDGETPIKDESGDIQSSKIVELKDLDQKYQDEISPLISGDPAKTAKELENWIRTAFTYSMDEHYSHYYQKARNKAEFFNRLLEKRHADCDVANTMLVASLRMAGIPARMVYGYYNQGDSGQTHSGDNLSYAERHGWTEAFIDGRWVKLDGTPTKADPYTQKILNRLRESGALGSQPGGGESGAAPGYELAEGEDSNFLLELFKFRESLKDSFGMSLENALACLAGVYSMFVIRAYWRLKHVRDRGDKLVRMASRELSDMYEGKAYYPENQVNHFYWNLLSESEELVDQKRLSRFKFFRIFQRAGASAVLPFTRQYRNAEGRYKEFQQVQNKLEDVRQQVEGRTLDLAQEDPLSMLGELVGFPKKEVQREIINENVDTTLNQLRQLISNATDFYPTELYGGLPALEQDLRDKLDEELFGDEENRVRLLRRFKNSDLFIDFVVKKAYEIYAKEAEKIASAKALPEKKRNANQRTYAQQQNLTLTEEKFSEIFNETCAMTYRAIWDIAQSST